MIAVEALTKRYGRNPVVDRVSFAVDAGEVAGLIGPAGAGKSILLRMLVGLVRPTSGWSALLGQPYAKLKRPLQQVGVALGPGGHPSDTVWAHLRVRAALAGVSEGRAGEVLKRVGLDDQADSRIGELVLGSRQRLALAGALVGDPDVIVIDEPTDGLAVDGRCSLHACLRSLAGDGRAVLVASREIDALAPALDSVLFMQGGRLVARTSAEQLLAHDEAGVVVESPGAEVLAERLDRAGVPAELIAPNLVRAREVEAATVGEAVRALGMPVHELRREEPDHARALNRLLAELPALDGDEAQDTAHSENGDPGRTDLDERFAALEERLAAELEEGHRPSAPRTVAVLAPTPGQGRSTLAYVLADVLARRLGAAPLVVGLGAGPVAGLADSPVDARPELGLVDLIEDLPGFDELSRLDPYVTPTRAGVTLLDGAADARRLADVTPRQIDELLAFAGRFHDLLVLDIGELAPAALRQAVQAADCVLLVGAREAGDHLARSPLPDLIADEHAEPAIVVANRSDATGPPLLATLGSANGHVAVPRDLRLVRLLDEGEYDPEELEAASRVAVLALGAAVARRVSR